MDGEMVIRVTPSLSFPELHLEIARYFGITEAQFLLLDSTGVVWPVTMYYGAKWETAFPTLFVDVPRAALERYAGLARYRPFEERRARGAAEALGTRDQLMMDNPFNTGRVLRLYGSRALYVRSAIAYLLFVALYMASVFARRSIWEERAMTRSVAQPLLWTGQGPVGDVQFTAISRIDEIWGWLDGPLRWAMFDEDRIPGSGAAYPAFGQSNVLAGPIRVQQLRVSAGSCKLSATIPSNWSASCFAPYSAAAASTTSFAASNSSACNISAFAYTDVAGGASVSLTGELSSLSTVTASSALAAVTSSAPKVVGELATYDLNGFIVDIVPTNALDWSSKFATLRACGWIDAGTRALIVTFNTYNAATNGWVVAQFLLEVGPGGEVVPTFRVRPLVIEDYGDLARVPVYLVVVVVIGCLAVSGIMEMKLLFDSYRSARAAGKAPFASLWTYFRDPWNSLEVSIVVLYFAALAHRGELYLEPAHGTRLPWPQYVDLTKAAGLYTSATNMESVILLLLLVKSFKFVALSRKMNLMWITLSHAAPFLVYFFMVFSVILIAFVILAHGVFGAESGRFSQFIRSLRSLLLLLLGSVDYEELTRINQVWAPVFYILYVVVQYMVLVNVFLAILNRSYRLVRARYLAVQRASSGRDVMPSLTPAELVGAVLPFVNELRAAWSHRHPAHGPAATAPEEHVD